MVFLFARVPRDCRKLFSHSREARKPAGELFLVCGSPASLPETFFSFAEAPRACRKLFSRSRESREPVGGLFPIRGGPASTHEKARPSPGWD